MVVCGGWKERTERTESVEEGERSKTTIMTYRRCVVVIIIIVVRMGASVCVCVYVCVCVCGCVDRIAFYVSWARQYPKDPILIPPPLLRIPLLQLITLSLFFTVDWSVLFVLFLARLEPPRLNRRRSHNQFRSSRSFPLHFSHHRSEIRPNPSTTFQPKTISANSQDVIKTKRISTT